MTLSFDSLTHTYAVDGKSLPSVTGILRACGLTGQYEFRDPIHAMRGTAVHEGAALIISGVRKYPTLEPLRSPHSHNAAYVQVHGEIDGYWEAVRAAKAMIKFSGCVYEARFIDPVRGCAGTFDFGAYVASANQLWDIKSGMYPVMTPVQICAYEDLARRGLPINPDHPGLPWLQELVKSGQPIERCGLRLEKTGRFTAYYECPKGRPYTSPMWMSAWRSALCLYTLVPDHHYLYTDIDGYHHKGSRLSEVNWTVSQIKERLTGPNYYAAMKAGENLYNLREAYGLL